MGIRENTIITKTCTYDAPDDYLYQTNTLGNTWSYEYEGPDKLWIFISEETGRPLNGQCFTIKDDGDEIPTPPGQVKILVDDNVDTVIASMIWRHKYYDYLPTQTEQLPDGTSYTRPINQPPDHTYEFMECVYNIAAGEWVKPLPWKKPHVTWDDLRKARTAMLAASDKTLATTLMSDQERAAFEVYRQKLRDLPAVFEGVDPWKVIFPTDPTTGVS